MRKQQLAVLAFNKIHFNNCLIEYSCLWLRYFAVFLTTTKRKVIKHVQICKHKKRSDFIIACGGLSERPCQLYSKVVSRKDAKSLCGYKADKKKKYKNRSKILFTSRHTMLGEFIDTLFFFACWCHRKVNSRLSYIRFKVWKTSSSSYSNYKFLLIVRSC